MALGTTEVTPLQIAAAYALSPTVAGCQPTVIARVIDNSIGGTVVEDWSTDRQVIKPTTAYMITDMLADVTRRGTARRANGIFKNVAIAGKTGTSRDGWFVGYTPNLVCAVWIGFDDNKQLGLTGAEAALPAWIDFMEEALAIRPSLGGTSFLKPRGITTVKIDPETGFLAGPNCPSSQTVNVPAQFAPAVECLEHRPVESDLLYEDYSSELDSLHEAPEDKSLAEAVENQSADESLVAEHSKATHTTTNLDQKGRVTLVSEPANVDLRLNYKATRQRQ